MSPVVDRRLKVSVFGGTINYNAVPFFYKPVEGKVRGVKDLKERQPTVGGTSLVCGSWDRRLGPSCTTNPKSSSSKTPTHLRPWSVPSCLLKTFLELPKIRVPLIPLFATMTPKRPSVSGYLPLLETCRGAGTTRGQRSPPDFRGPRSHCLGRDISTSPRLPTRRDRDVRGVRRSRRGSLNDIYVLGSGWGSNP